MWHTVDVSNVSINLFFLFPLEFAPSPENYLRKSCAVFTVNKNYVPDACVVHSSLLVTGEYADDKDSFTFEYMFFTFYWLTSVADWMLENSRLVGLRNDQTH